MGVKASAVGPVFQGVDEIGGLGLVGGGEDLCFVGPGAAVANIVADAAVQQRGVLRHHGDLCAQAFLRHGGDVLAVDQDAAGVGGVEAQQQVHQGGFAGAGMAHQADTLAWFDVQVEAVQHAAFGAVAEGDVLEADGAVRDREFFGVRGVGHLAGDGDAFHAVLHHADILENAGDVVGDPAGDVGDLPGEGEDGGDRADGDGAAGPEQNGDGAGGGEQAGVDQREGDRIARVHTEAGVEGGRMFVHRLADEIVLILGAGEEFHGEDVGVAVHDAAGERGADLAHGAGAVAQAGDVIAQHGEIGDHPAEQRDAKAPIVAEHQREGGDAVDADIPDRIHRGDDAFAQGGAGLHDAVGHTAGEVVLKEGPALADDVPVALPAHQIGKVAGDRLVGDEGACEEGCGAADQQG